MNASLDLYWDRAKKCYDLKEIERLGLSPDLDQRELILKYLSLIFKWNEVAQLVSPNDEECLFLRHFCDSLQPLLLFGFKKNAYVLDIHADAGFPSIPIRIIRPDLEIILVESDSKKVSFLNEVIKELNFENVSVFHGCVDDMKVSSRKYDYILNRGVCSMQDFTKTAKPYLAPDGRMYTYKTKQFTDEITYITVNKDKDKIRINEIAEYDLGNHILGLNLVSLEFTD